MLVRGIARPCGRGGGGGGWEKLSCDLNWFELDLTTEIDHFKTFRQRFVNYFLEWTLKAAFELVHLITDN